MIEEILNTIKQHENYKGQIVKIYELNGVDYKRCEVPSFIDERVRKALERLGIFSLYTHQVEAIEALKNGFNVILTSSTASGKTLAFNIPVLDALYRNKKATALYLYPTKALAQDQLEKLKLFSEFPIGTYDGDTPQDERIYLRNKGRIIIANPDILHVGLLPNHLLFGRFLSNLKFIVIDEAHYYSGVLGSHFAMVMRRLRRILSYYGSFPQFFLSSATLENPEEFSFKLVGEHFKWIKGPALSPFKKLFVIFNPAIVNETLNIRKSTLSEAIWIVETLLNQGKNVIVFEKSRKGVEILSKQLKERIGNTFEISPYRAGYTVTLRREIEKRIKSGQVRCVVSTNALELGIDIGELDATVIVGYPGTLSSLFQQSGRSGRVKESITFFIVSSNPLDQYFTKDPEYLFSNKFESISIDLDNPYIIKPHLACAAYEVPLSPDIDSEYFGNYFGNGVKELESNGTIVKKSEHFFLNSKTSIASQFSLRSTGEEHIRLIDMETGKTIEKMSKKRALEEAFPSAVYLHLTETYVVKKMDLENGVIYLKKEQTDFYTDALAIETIWIEKTIREKQLRHINVYFGEVVVEEVIRGFVKKQFFTDRKIETCPLDLPKIEFKTKAMWFTIEDSIVNKIKSVEDLPGSIHALEHALVGMLPIIVQCDRKDIGGVSHPKHPDTNLTSIFLYDGVEGGIGITEKAFERVEDLLNITFKSISSCPCKEGCPSCIYSPKCGNENKPLSKNGSILLLKEILS